MKLNMKKNIFLLFLALCSFSAIHAEKSGNINWNLSDDGTLTISGTGDMPDYFYYLFSGYERYNSPSPWYNDRDKINKVVIKDGLTSIGDFAFYECRNITSVTIPNSVTSIGEYAFWSCASLTSVIIPNSVTSIGNCAFAYCRSLTSVTIPNSVRSMGDGTFQYCSLTSITISSTVTSIGSATFQGCYYLTSVEIPNSVTNIGDYAFRSCDRLALVTFKGSTPPEFGKGVFNNIDKSIPVYVPANSIEEYENALEGFGLSNIQALPPLSLNDNVSYTRDLQTDDIDVSYTRNFTNVNWQAIYLPFSLKYDDLKDDFELAYINTVRQYDKDNDGVIDKTEMEIIKIKSGSTKPNMPYLIRAKTTGEKTFSAENATVYAAEENSVDCSTTIAKFTITGTYKPIPSETMIANNYYGMGGGKLIQSDGSNGLNPYRWYMKVEARDYSKYKVSNAAKAITIKVLDEESETTGIDELFASSPASQFQITNYELPVYDINGRKVNENSLKPGIYVKNGKKFVVK